MSGCKRCGGAGRRAYASTAVWRGGMGGASITEAVCDGCWGSGDEAAPGPNLRKQEAEAAAEWRRRYREDAAFRWKERARRFARRAYNHRENYRSLIKYQLNPMRDEIARLNAEVARLSVLVTRP